MNSRTPESEPTPKPSALTSLALFISVSLGVVLALPNQNITYYDDLGVIALFAYPAFAVLIALLVSAVRKRRPAHLRILLVCAAVGAFHLTATLLHLTATHNLNRLLSSEQPMTEGGHADFISGSSMQILTRSRILSHGSGSYVFEELYRPGDGERGPLITWSYGANQTIGVLPNWTVPLRVLPWRRQPQYWICLNQSRPRNSVLLTAERDLSFRATPDWSLYLSAVLILLPYGLALFGRERAGWVLLISWVILYQPWWAWFW
jgi:hypothetical protein